MCVPLVHTLWQHSRSAYEVGGVDNPRLQWNGWLQSILSAAEESVTGAHRYSPRMSLFMYYYVLSLLWMFSIPSRAETRKQSKGIPRPRRLDAHAV
jgi:hypothetical protein